MLGLGTGGLGGALPERRAAAASAREARRRRVAAWQPAAPASESIAAAGRDPRAWRPSRGPSAWARRGYDGMNGVAWYCTTFELSEAEAAAGIVLGVGQIGDTDTTWVNGHLVGSTANAYNKPRVYQVPAGVL